MTTEQKMAEDEERLFPRRRASLELLLGGAEAALLPETLPVEDAEIDVGLDERGLALVELYYLLTS
jgi:hypothetical protein